MENLVLAGMIYTGVEDVLASLNKEITLLDSRHSRDVIKMAVPAGDGDITLRRDWVLDDQDGDCDSGSSSATIKRSDLMPLVQRAYESVFVSPRFYESRVLLSRNSFRYSARYSEGRCGDADFGEYDGKVRIRIEKDISGFGFSFAPSLPRDACEPTVRLERNKDFYAERVGIWGDFDRLDSPDMDYIRKAYMQGTHLAVFIFPDEIVARDDGTRTTNWAQDRKKAVLSIPEVDDAQIASLARPEGIIRAKLDTFIFREGEREEEGKLVKLLGDKGHHPTIMRLLRDGSFADLSDEKYPCAE